MSNWFTKLFKSKNIRYICTVPPNAEIHAQGIAFANDTDKVIDLYIEVFPDRRQLKEDRRDDTSLRRKDSNKQRQVILDEITDATTDS